MIIKKLLRSQSGFSLVETMLTAGLLGIAITGVYTLSQKIQNSSQKSQGLLARTHFASAMSTYLVSTQGCTDLKTARMAGAAFTTTPSDIALTTWQYMGNTNIRGGKDASGKYFTKFPNLAIEHLRAFIQPVSTESKIKSKDTAGTVVELARSNLTVQARLRVQNFVYDHIFNVPVLVGASGAIQNVIMHCSDERTVAESCATMKGVYNPTTNSCDLESGCLLRDTYQVLTGGDLRLGPSKVNKFTGGYTCPSGSTAVRTHSASWTSKVSCGKKCTSNQYNNKEWFSCMECP